LQWRSTCHRRRKTTVYRENGSQPHGHWRNKTDFLHRRSQTSCSIAEVKTKLNFPNSLRPNTMRETPNGISLPRNHEPSRPLTRTGSWQLRKRVKVWAALTGKGGTRRYPRRVERSVMVTSAFRQPTGKPNRCATWTAPELSLAVAGRTLLVCRGGRDFQTVGVIPTNDLF